MMAASSSSRGIVSRKPFRFQMANGSMPEVIASPTPHSESRRLKITLCVSGFWNWKRFKQHVQRRQRAMDGSISTVTTPSISPSRPLKRKRENE